MCVHVLLVEKHQFPQQKVSFKKFVLVFVQIWPCLLILGL